MATVKDLKRFMGKRGYTIIDEKDSIKCAMSCIVELEKESIIRDKMIHQLKNLIDKAINALQDYRFI